MKDDELNLIDLKSGGPTYPASIPIASATPAPPVAQAEFCNSNYSGAEYVAVATATPVAAAASPSAAASFNRPSTMSTRNYTTGSYVPSPAAMGSQQFQQPQQPPMAFATTDPSEAMRNGHWVAPSVFSPPVEPPNQEFKMPSIFTPPPGWVEPPSPTGHHSSALGQRRAAHPSALENQGRSYSCSAVQQAPTRRFKKRFSFRFRK